MELLSTIHAYYTCGLRAEEREVRNRMQAGALKLAEDHVTLHGAEPTLKNVDHCYRWLKLLCKNSEGDPKFIYILNRMYWLGTLLPAVKKSLEAHTSTGLVKLWDYVNDCEKEDESDEEVYEAFPPFSFFELVESSSKEDETVLAGHDLARHHLRLIQIRAGSVTEAESARLWEYGFKWLRKTHHSDITQPRPVDLDRLQTIFQSATRASDLVAYTQLADRPQLDAFNKWLVRRGSPQQRLNDPYTDHNFPLFVEVRRKRAKPLETWKVQAFTIQQLRAVGDLKN